MIPFRVLMIGFFKGYPSGYYDRVPLRVSTYDRVPQGYP